MRGMASVCKSKDNQNQARHNGTQSPPVHANSFILLVEVSWNGQESGNSNAEDDDGTDPKVPPPGHKVGTYSPQEDAKVESQTSKGTPDGKHQILSRARPVRLSQESQTGGCKGGSANALKGSADDQHDGICAEAADKRPNHEPDVAKQKDRTGTVDVAQSRKGHQKSGSGEVNDAGGPGPRVLGDVEGVCHGRQDDVEAADEVLAHGHGHDDGHDEADFCDPGLEDGWAGSAEAFELSLVGELAEV